MSTLYIKYPGPGAIPAGSFPLLAPDGTVSAPSYSFTNSATSGLYSPAVNQVAITTNGAQGFLVDASQVSYFASQLVVNANAAAFPASATYDGYAAILRTNGSGSAPFDQAGSMVYRPRLTATTGRSSHYFYTGATPSLGLKIDEVQDVTASSGNLKIGTAGKGLFVKEGSNAKMGTVTLAAGTATVSTTAVTASSRIFLTAQSLGTVSVGQGLAVSAVVAGTSFTIKSQSASDTSVVAWMMVEPA